MPEWKNQICLFYDINHMRRSSPKREREPDDGQPHHVLSHGVIKALHQIQVDLKMEQIYGRKEMIKKIKAKSQRELFNRNVSNIYPMNLSFCPKEKLCHWVARFRLHFYKFIQLFGNLDPVHLEERENDQDFHLL